MRKIFSLGGPVMEFLTLVADMMILNLLWILCSLPIVTMGASTAALHYCVRKLACHEGDVAKNFWHAFQENFKQATALWLLALLAGAVMAADFSLLLCITFPGKTIVMLLLGLFLILCILMTAYIFPLQSRFKNTVRGTLVNAFCFSLRYPDKAILMSIPTVIYVVLLIYKTDLFLRLGGVFFLFGASVPAYFFGKLIDGVFEPYRSR